MTFAEAMNIVKTQRRCFRKINGLRFFEDAYEYRIRYEGGFAEFFILERRKIGKRNFKYFEGTGAYDCMSADDVIAKLTALVKKSAIPVDLSPHA